MLIDAPPPAGRLQCKMWRGASEPSANPSASATADRERELAGSVPAGQDVVDEPVRLGLDRRHEVVALGVVLDLLDGLAGVLRVERVDRVARLQDLTRADLDV